MSPVSMRCPQRLMRVAQVVSMMSKGFTYRLLISSCVGSSNPETSHRAFDYIRSGSALCARMT